MGYNNDKTTSKVCIGDALGDGDRFFDYFEYADEQWDGAR